MDAVPCEALEGLFDEIANAPDTEDLLRGLYLVAVPQLRLEMEKYRVDTHPLADALTRRLLRTALLDMTDIEDYGKQVQSAYGLEEPEWHHRGPPKVSYTGFPRILALKSALRDSTGSPVKWP